MSDWRAQSHGDLLYSCHFDIPVFTDLDLVRVCAVLASTQWPPRRPRPALHADFVPSRFRVSPAAAVMPASELGASAVLVVRQ